MFNFVTKKPYSGKNAEILASKNFSSPYFLTFKQAQANGRRVRKGEKGITLMRVVRVEERVSDGRQRPSNKPKYFSVFNIEQTEEIAKKSA
jgi:antirestriction protein ArdC